VAVVGIARDRLPTPAVVGIRIPAVTPAPVASAAIGTVAAGIVMAADIITGVTTVAAITTVAVEGITLGGSIREVLSLDMRPGPIVPSNISSRAVWDGVQARVNHSDLNLLDHFVASAKEARLGHRQIPMQVVLQKQQPRFHTSEALLV
jgi:hypothetical protein